MGSEQFATGMTSTDKAQMNRIETNTDTIITEVGKSGGKEFEYHWSDSTSGSFIEALNISGKGSLSQAIITSNSSSSYPGYMRIYLDGTEIFNGRGYNGNVSGISKNTLLSKTDTNLFTIGKNSFLRKPSQNIVNTPYIGTYGLVLLNGDISFSTSLKIDIHNQSGNTSYPAEVQVLYNLN